MIIRLTYLTSALSLAAAASKSAKTPVTSSKSETSYEYFLAPFSCPQKCISAHGYEPSSHLLEDEVSDCDVSDSYQKWRVHQVGSLLKFESAAQHYHNMCLAVVHQDSDSDEVGQFQTPFYDSVQYSAGVTCNGELGLANCDHPGTNWYNTGGNLLSALCWDQFAPAAMSVNEECTDLRVSGDLTTAETFMILGLGSQ